MMQIQGIAYKKQFGFNSIHTVPTNLYGPFDAFDEYRSHVVGALVAKFCDAQDHGHDVTVWGSGNPIREFMFVEDCADGIILAGEKYNDTSPLNIGTGIGTSIRAFVEDLCAVLKFKNRIIWDTSKPDGQLAKTLDIAKMKAVLDWVPRTNIQDGLAKTISFYREHRVNHAPVKRAA